jgi:hypothetical protein
LILETAKQHFDEDYARAMAMRDHADGLPHGVLRDDLLRSAWMVGVGAGDAFFCDAYADLVSRTLRAKERQTNGVIPDRLNNLRVPVIAVISAASSWRWRMAARELIEKESVLSLKQIKDLLNVFCRKDHRLLSQQTIEGWVLHGDAQQRHFSVSRATFLRLLGLLETQQGRALSKPWTGECRQFSKGGTTASTIVTVPNMPSSPYPRMRPGRPLKMLVSSLPGAPII